MALFMPSTSYAAFHSGYMLESDGLDVLEGRKTSKAANPNITKDEVTSKERFLCIFRLPMV